MVSNFQLKFYIASVVWNGLIPFILFDQKAHLFYPRPPSRISAFSLRRKLLGTIVLSRKGALAAMTRRIAIAWPFAGTKIANLKMQASSATYNMRPRAVTSV